MKQNPFGLHTMDFNVPDAEMWAYYAAARPAMTVILNNHLRAQQVKATLPEMIVVHRQVNDNDPKWFTLITSQAWVEANRPFGSNGVVVACLNEPGGDFRNDVAYRERFIDWLIGVMDEAEKAYIKVALPNWSVGNPHESTIENGGFDRLLRRVAKAGDAVYWSCHEYWHDDPVAEYPFTIGRNEFWSDRVAELGLPPINLLLTEYGMDKGGGHGDGFHNQGISDETYADQFKASRTVLVNKPPGAIYGFGEGFGWGSFNIAGSKVPDLLKDYQEEVFMPDPIPAPTTGGKLVQITGFPPNILYRNVRQQPRQSATDLGDLKVDDVVTAYISALQDGDAGQWCYVERPTDNVKGWVLWTGVVFVEQPPVGGETVEISLVDFNNAVKALEQARTDLIAQKAALAQALADNVSSLTSVDAALASLKGVMPPVGGGF